MARMDKLSNYKTKIEQESGVTYVTYHNTVIVRFDGQSVTLNLGGWDTVTTRRKLAQAARQFGLPYTVYRRDGVTMIESQGKAEAMPIYKPVTISM